jgi:hypothetical protein
VALRVALTELSQGAQPAQKAVSGTHPAIQALALLGLAFGFYCVLNRAPAPESARSSAECPPARFAKQPRGGPHADLEAARSLAEQDHLDADNRRERSPFYPRPSRRCVDARDFAGRHHGRVGDPPLRM